MTFKEYLHLEEKAGLLPAALLGLGLMGSGIAGEHTPVVQNAFLSRQEPLKSPAKPIISQMDYIAATLVLEAGGEKDVDGMVAVYNVLQNRAKIKKDSLYDQAMKPKQFSCWNADEFDGMSRGDRVKKAKSHPKWEDAVRIVRSGDAVADTTGGATHYYRRDMKNPPDWASTGQKTVVIGKHIFFKGIRF